MDLVSARRAGGTRGWMEAAKEDASKARQGREPQLVSSGCLEAGKGGGVNINNPSLVQMHLHLNIFHRHWQKITAQVVDRQGGGVVEGGVTGLALQPVPSTS